MIEIERPVDANSIGFEWGSDAIALMLRSLELPFLCVTPGASFRGLHDSVVNALGNRAPQMLLCLHEESAVAIAHGYAKVTGKPLGVVLHSNVGLMHGTMAIFNAWCDRMPMLIVGATGPIDATRRRPWVDWIHTARDQAAMIRHYTKWDDLPASIPAAYEALLRASMMTSTAPCGPVDVCLDAGLQEARQRDDRAGADARALSAAGGADAGARSGDARRRDAGFGEGAADPDGARVAERGGLEGARGARRAPWRHRAHRSQDRGLVPHRSSAPRRAAGPAGAAGSAGVRAQGRRGAEPRLGRRRGHPDAGVAGAGVSAPR